MSSSWPGEWGSGVGWESSQLKGVTYTKTRNLEDGFIEFEELVDNLVYLEQSDGDCLFDGT